MESKNINWELYEDNGGNLFIHDLREHRVAGIGGNAKLLDHISDMDWIDDLESDRPDEIYSPDIFTSGYELVGNGDSDNTIELFVNRMGGAARNFCFGK